MSNTHQPVHSRWPGLIEAYRDRLPIGDDWEPVTLYEGGTPLIRATHLSAVTGCEVYLKVEGLNPTGSFKDRGMTMAVTDAKARGQKAVLCASTGNTSASAAAYATRAGMECAVLIPQGKIAAGKLAQAVMHGATIIQVDGNFDDCLELARKTTATYVLESTDDPAAADVRLHRREVAEYNERWGISSSADAPSEPAAPEDGVRDEAPAIRKDTAQ